MPIDDFIRRPEAGPWRLDTRRLWGDAGRSSGHVDIVLDHRGTSLATVTDRGGTRFGGDALLPAGTAWPASPRGLLAFVGQLDMGELHTIHRGELSLPEHGVLGLFYDVEERRLGNEPGDEAFLQLVYVPEPARGVVHRPPAHRAPVRRPALRRSRALSSIRVLEWLGGGGGHRVGGDPSGLDALARVQFELLEAGLARSGEPVLRTLVELEREGHDTVALARRAKRWRLVWQLESLDVPFIWADAGVLYVFVADEDLVAGRFDRPRFAVESP